MLPNTPLTQIEADIVKLLAEGLTRREIEDELRLSEKSVKKHISILLTKFGGTNLRDIFFRLKEYYEYFIKLDGRFFYHSLILDLNADQDMRTVRTHKKSDVEVAHKEASENVFVAYEREGQVEDILYNGQPMTLVNTMNARGRYVHKYPYPLQPGTKFFKEETATMRRNTVQDEHSFNFEVGFPCAYFEWNINFPPNKRPKSIDTEFFFMDQKISSISKDITIRDTETGLYISYPRPKFGVLIRATWTW